MFRRIVFAATLPIAACTGGADNRRADDQAEAGSELQSLREPGRLADTRGPIDPRSAQGAAQVVQHYFALIESRRFDEAANLWREGAGTADPTVRFEGFRELHANVGAPGAVEGAAGSLYVEVPVQLHGRLRSGEPFNRIGSMTLRRANEVPGATAEQRAWRIDRADLFAGDAPAQRAYRFVGRWAAEARLCPTLAWRFTATSLDTPAGSVCRFSRVTEVPGGYNVAARCTAEGPPTEDVLRLRFAESAQALMFESQTIADVGLVRCPTR